MHLVFLIYFGLCNLCSYRYYATGEHVNRCVSLPPQLQHSSSRPESGQGWASPFRGATGWASPTGWAGGFHGSCYAPQSYPVRVTNERQTVVA